MSTISEPTAGRIYWLDALRGYAILGVILVHSGQVVPSLRSPWVDVSQAGQYGVQLFFVVSALTIGLTYERLLSTSSGFDRRTAAWWVKRIFRIAPLYYYGILLYAALAFLHFGASNPARTDPGGIASNVLFIHSWIPSAQNSVVPGGWSIGVEVCFYAIAPFLLVMLRDARTAFLALVASIAGAWILNAYSASLTNGEVHITNNSYLYFWFPTQLPVFLVGVLLFRTKAWERDVCSRFKSNLILPSGLIFAALGLAFGTLGNIDHTFAPVCMAIAFSCAISVRGLRLLDLALRSQLMNWFGQLSYSMYINHFVVISMIRAVDRKYSMISAVPAPVALILIFGIVVSTTSIAALFTRHLIERPGIRLGHFVARRVGS